MKCFFQLQSKHNSTNKTELRHNSFICQRSEENMLFNIVRLKPILIIKVNCFFSEMFVTRKYVVNSVNYYWSEFIITDLSVLKLEMFPSKVNVNDQLHWSLKFLESLQRFDVRGNKSRLQKNEIL